MASKKEAKVTDKATKKKLEKINEDFVKKGAEKITDKDVKKVIDKADEIKDQFSSGGPLGRFIEDAKLLISVVKDYWSGEYREIPYLSLAAIVFALLYVVNPFDIIPDPIPVVGQLDDAAVIGFCLYLVEQHLREYKQWKVNQTT